MNEIPFILDKPNTDPIELPDGSHLNCLLYADDLVLISHSASGLQNALTQLSQFCTNWMLNINPKKTKVMIFEKKCRKSTIEKYKFFISSNIIDIVNNYTYLGVNFSSNGNFSNHKIKAKEKTRRSIFATRCYLDFSLLSIYTCTKIFDSLFAPILLYGSEVWGAYDKTDSISYEKDIIEKTHIYFCKLFLGVNKRCSNVGCRNEIGRLPLQEIINVRIIKYLKFLEDLPNHNIAKQCLEMCKEMSKKNQMNYTQKISILSRRYNLPDTSCLISDIQWNKFIANFKKIMKQDLVDHQKNLLKTNKKLAFYTIFKTENKKAEFLDYIKNPHHKKVINKFRLGNHKLRIETGRHTIPKTPEHLRICQICNTPEIENETHFLFYCIAYNDIRMKFFKEMSDKYPVFDKFDDMEKIVFLFNNVDPFICRSVAAFVTACMDRREQLL